MAVKQQIGERQKPAGEHFKKVDESERQETKAYLKKL